MSLLEDIFLQDEAGEAQELERVIEGNDYDETTRSRSESPEGDENINRDDEAEEDKRRVDPSSTKAKRVVKNPRFILNPARLTGPRGIQVIPDHFKDFKFKGKGHEKEDLDMVLKKLEHWAYRLYPKFQFEDCLKKIETLGKKRPVMVHLQKIRSDQFISDETVIQKDSSDEETAPPQEEDEFDKLLQQQIELARATPAPGSVKKLIDTHRQDRSPFTMPKATSSPSISDEQKERMLRNRKLAEERRLARLKQTIENNEKQFSSSITDIEEVSVEETDVPVRKHNKSNVIDSSDDEGEVTNINQAITVDVHTSNVIPNIENGVTVEMNINVVKDVEMNENVVEINIIKDSEINDTTNNCNTQIDRDTVENADISNKNLTQIANSNQKVDKIVVIDEEMSKDGNDDMIENKTYIHNDDQVSTSVSDDKSETECNSKSTLKTVTNNEKTIEETVSKEENYLESSNYDTNKKTVNVALTECDTGSENAFAEDIMDVDFSEEF